MLNVDSCTEIRHDKLNSSFFADLMFAVQSTGFIVCIFEKMPCTFGSFILCSVFKGQIRYHVLR